MKYPSEQEKENLIIKAMELYKLSRNEASNRLNNVKYNWDMFEKTTKSTDPTHQLSTAAFTAPTTDEVDYTLQNSKEDPMFTKAVMLPTDDDAELQRVIVDSFKSHHQNENPKENMRQEGMPVGLHNVGNTCYVNSLLQTYFMLPSLRNLVFRVPTDPKETDDERIHRVKKFMRELQLLFARLILSAKKSVDPSNVLNAIVDQNGKCLLSIGQQEDLGEFMNLFVDWMERGLKLLTENQNQDQNPNQNQNQNQDQDQNPNQNQNQDQNQMIISHNINNNILNENKNNNSNNNQIQQIDQLDYMKQMFEIGAVDVLSASEQDGDPVECESKSVHNFLILDVKYKEFYYALDEAFMGDAVEWKTPKGFCTHASKRTWITHLPTVVMFQEMRAIYDVITKRAEKNRTPLNFSKDIDLDRYLYENRKMTTEIRAIVKKHRIELETSELKLQELSSCPEIHVPYAQLFEVIIKALDEHPDVEGERMIDEGEEEKLQTISPSPPPANPEIKSALQKRVDFFKNLSNDYHNHCQKVRELIDTAYPKMMEEHSYTLFAVWIHSGPTPGSGHYWTYIKDFQKDVWIKFNDRAVDIVKELEVWTDAVGDNSDISAYSLIYIKKEAAISFCSMTDSRENISGSVREQVERENEEFRESLTKGFNSNSSSRGGDGSGGQCEAKDRNALNFANGYIKAKMEILEDKDNDPHPRIYSYGLWLKALGSIPTSVTLTLVMFDVWYSIYNNKLQQECSSDSAQYRIAKTYVESLGAKEDMTQEVFDNATRDEYSSLKCYYESFRYYVAYLHQGLKSFNIGQPDTALKCFVGAYEKYKNIHLQWKNDCLLDIIRISVISFVESILSSIRLGWTNDFLTMAASVVHRIFFKEEEKWLQELRARCIDAILRASETECSGGAGGGDSINDVVMYWTGESETPPIPLPAISIEFMNPKETALLLMKEYQRFYSSLHPKMVELFPKLPQRLTFTANLSNTTLAAGIVKQGGDSDTVMNIV